MKIIKNKLDASLNTYPIHHIGDPNDILFLDIETTGFTARTSDLYMIGCIFYDKDEWILIQWMSESVSEEAFILKDFLKLCGTKKILIHYNGNNFDLPFLKQKCKQHNLEAPFDQMTGIDIYQRIAPYKKMLKLDNCKQKTIEAYLEIERDDKFHGGELIEIYKDYCKTKSEYGYNVLLLHNADDMKGMFQILSILTYSDLFVYPFKVVKVQANRYTDLNGISQEEVLMKIRFDAPFPKAILISEKGCRFSAEGKEAILRVPLYRCELKYYYANYKEYYYLPLEDISLHKSVAAYVNKNHRVPATAATCYTRKESSYLPQWDIIFEPLFKKEYNSNELFFELTDEMKRSPEEFRKYALHILDMLAHNQKREKRIYHKK